MPHPTPWTSRETIEFYNPAIGRYGLVEPAEWAAIGDLVRAAVEPFAHLKGEQIRPYLRAMTKLTAFVLRIGGELTIASVLAPRTVKGFLRSQPAGARDEEPLLWRLAQAHGTVALDSPVQVQIGRRVPKPPYSAAEIDALMLAARSQPTKLRRLNITAIVVLGAGAGLVRRSVRDVCAKDVHRHVDGVFVRASGRCARVLPEFEAVLESLAAQRRRGRLLGSAQPKFSTVKAHQWLDYRRGVPRLSVDRLRATYIVTLLTSPVSIHEVMAATGHESWHSLLRYARYLPRQSTCPLEKQEK